MYSSCADLVGAFSKFFFLISELLAFTLDEEVEEVWGTVFLVDLLSGKTVDF